jgi:tetratricopeptide (TPR) repeat protein
LARKKPSSAATTLREIEETGDRLATWAAEHAVVILGTIAAVLVIAAGAGLYVQHAGDARDEAANALALAMSQYRTAMGADPLGGPIVEPANPELGAQTRTKYVERFIAVAHEYADTPSGAVAWLEAGGLQAELGRMEDAAKSFEAAREAGGDRAIAALASMRLANLAEDQGDLESAAEAYEQAASVEAYPLAADALVEAARCWAQAGQADRALTVYQRFETEHPEASAPPWIASLMAELRLER